MESVNMSVKLDLDNLAQEISYLSEEEVVKFVLQIDNYAMSLSLTKALVKKLKKVIKNEEVGMID